MPYNYTVEVTNRLEELDLIDRVPEELWMDIPDIVEEVVRGGNVSARSLSLMRQRHEYSREEGHFFHKH